MSAIRYASIAPPLDAPGVPVRVAAALRRAGAMGLVAAKKPARAPLDAKALAAALAPVARRGIARVPLARLAAATRDEVARALDDLNVALLESPAPDAEWRQVLPVLGVDLLTRLLGVSAPSVQRYAKGVRPTPAEVAARLHFLALVAGDLGGAYNPLGIRMWFDRPRAQLAGKAPIAILSGDWKAQDEGPERVRRLAEALTGSPAT